MAAAAGEEERTTDADKRGFPVIRASSNCSPIAHMVIGMRIKDRVFSISLMMMVVMLLYVFSI